LTSGSSASQPLPPPSKQLVLPTPIRPPKLENLSLFENGALLIDKPSDWTSFDVCGKLRNTLKFIGVKKVGHAGTLDPMATGLLIVCTGKGTKACDTFMAMGKEYSGVIRLGEGTPSYDAESEVSERAPWEHITDEDIQRVAASFVGATLQVPPMFSAIKMGGMKLYNLAREGQTIEREPRPINVSWFEVSRSPESPQDLLFRVQCSKGTYVRSLAHDLGKALGTVAHLTALRREAIGDYHVRDAWKLPDLIEQLQVFRDALGIPAPPPRNKSAPRKRRAVPTPDAVVSTEQVQA